MVIDQESMKIWIDLASYEDLLRKWRFASGGDAFFCGEVGKYYAEKIFAMRDALEPDEAAQVSKRIGW